jgi:hypothetical protein
MAGVATHLGKQARAARGHRLAGALPPLSLNTGKGVVAHRDGGTDPTELGQSVQPEIHRPTGGRHQGNHRSQPVMDRFEGGRHSGCSRVTRFLVICCG